MERTANLHSLWQAPLCGESSDREMGERDAKVSELLHEAAEIHR